MSIVRGSTPVVFLNSFPADRQQWEPLIAVLGDRLHGDVITFDFPGIGDMPLTQEEPSLELIADAAVLAMREATGADAAIWVGCSMGGYVALAVTERWPDAVAGLGLICTKAVADDSEAAKRREQTAVAAEQAGAHPDPRGAAESVISAQRPDHDSLVEWAELNISRQSGAGIAWGQRAMARRPDRTAVLRSVDAPLVVVLGAEDTTVRFEDGLAMAQAGGVEPTVLDGVGHLAALEDPTRVAEALEPLLSVQR